MKIFDFGTASNPTVAQDEAIRPLPSLSASMLWGSLSFGAVSVFAYSIWAFGLIKGAGPMFASIAIVYLGLSGLALSRLVRQPGVAWRFPLFFAAAFLAYAVVWCLFWFGLSGKYHADLYGSLIGLCAMTWMFQRAFGSREEFLPMFAVLFLFHTVGYYLGGEMHALFSGPAGPLLWGGFHGLGFGAGLGYVLWRCQRVE
jgi:hypothetical protein